MAKEGTTHEHFNGQQGGSLRDSAAAVPRAHGEESATDARVS